MKETFILISRTPKNLLLILASVDEQEKITQYLNDNMTQIDSMITKVEKQIALANDYLHNLIFRVLTGQVAVPHR